VFVPSFRLLPDRLRFRPVGRDGRADIYLVSGQRTPPRYSDWRVAVLRRRTASEKHKHVSASTTQLRCCDRWDRRVRICAHVRTYCICRRSAVVAVSWTAVAAGVCAEGEVTCLAGTAADLWNSAGRVLSFFFLSFFLFFFGVVMHVRYLSSSHARTLVVVDDDAACSWLAGWLAGGLAGAGPNLQTNILPPPPPPRAHPHPTTTVAEPIPAGLRHRLAPPTAPPVCFDRIPDGTRAGEGNRRGGWTDATGRGAPTTCTDNPTAQQTADIYTCGSSPHRRDTTGPAPPAASATSAATGRQSRYIRPQDDVAPTLSSSSTCLWNRDLSLESFGLFW
jgi:hypothetical protein